MCGSITHTWNWYAAHVANGGKSRFSVVTGVVWPVMEYWEVRSKFDEFSCEQSDDVYVDMRFGEVCSSLHLLSCRNNF